MSERDALERELEELPDPMIGEVRHVKASRSITQADFISVLSEAFGGVPNLSRPPQGEMPMPKNLA